MSFVGDSVPLRSYMPEAPFALLFGRDRLQCAPSRKAL